MKRFLIILFFIHYVLICKAQNYYQAGVTLGTSKLVRNNNDTSNLYNYNLNEVNLYGGKTIGWQNNDNQIWNKYWMTQLNLGIGQYQLTSNNELTVTTSGYLSLGLKFELPLDKNFKFESLGILGCGYHSGLDSRLSKGLSFKETLFIGFNKTWKNKSITQIGIGISHGSNAGIFPPNRGFNNLVIQLGYLWPQKK